MAYRADIEIAVKGAQELKRLQDQLSATSKLVDNLNYYIENIGSNGTVRNINNLKSALADAAAGFNKVALDTQEATIAAQDYIKTSNNLNAGLRERAQLLTAVAEAERKAQLAAAGVRERSQYAGPIGPGEASPVALSSQLRGRTEQILAHRKGATELSNVLQDLSEKQRQLENSKLDEKATQIQRALDAEAAAATESSRQIQNLSARQQEFTTRTDEAARAARAQTAEFIRMQRVAKQVAAINAAAPAAQLLLAPAAPGAPAMSGGARRQITGPVERLGGARTADEAQATFRLAQANTALSQSVSKIDPKYNRFLPDSATLNAAGRGIQQLTTNQQAFNNQVKSGTRYQEKLNQELERRRRLGINQPSFVAPGTTGNAGMGMGVMGSLGKRLPGAISGAAIGGAFPLLFGQSGGAATGGAIGGLAGGLLGPGGGFAGSLIGTLLGDIASRGQKVKELGQDIGFSAEQTNKLQQAFKLAGQDADKFTEAVQNIRGVGLAVEDQAKAIDLVSLLTKEYGGNIVKVTNALTGALETGKVTQGTLNQLTSQGILIQDALAAKYKTSRSNILEMAKDGKISVQDLINTLVTLANAADTSSSQQVNLFEVAYARIGLAATTAFATTLSSFDSTTAALSSKLPTLEQLFINTVNKILTSIENVILGLGEIGRIAGYALDPVINAFIGIKSEIDNVTANIPGIVSAIESIAQATVFAFAPALLILDRIAAFGKKSKNYSFGTEFMGPAGVEVPRARTFLAPSQAAPSGGSDKAAKDAERAAEAAAKEAARVQEIVRDRTASAEYMRIQSGLQDRIAAAEIARDPILAARLQGEQKILDIQYDYAKQLANEKNIQAQIFITYEGLTKITAEQKSVERELNKLYAERAQKITETVSNLELELALKQATTENERIQLQIAYDMQRLRDQGIPEDKVASIEALRQKVAAPESAGQIASKRVGALSDEIQKLTNLGNIAVTVADGIGTAFGQAFQGLISGSMSAREALGSFFKSVGDMFISMATEIIAKQMVMITLGLIQKALGIGASIASAGNAAGSAAFSGGKAAFNPGAFSMPKLAANGATFANGIAAFANGGIVGSPTLFKFADGGTTKTGLMGEAGPEAIMPLSRGSSGRLGVDAIGLREAMGGAPGGGGGGTTLNMSFQTSTINGVEYVSRDQLEAAMAQTRKDASRDGAKRGMNMTLDKIQNSPQTRSRVGIR